MEVAIVFWLLCGLFASIVAGSKGHSGFAWFFGGALFGPLALLASIGLARDQAAIDREAIAAGAMRKCPMCAETIKREAIKCRYCGADLSAPAVAALSAQQSEAAAVFAGEARAIAAVGEEPGVSGAWVGVFVTVLIAALIGLLVYAATAGDRTRSQRANTALPAPIAASSTAWREARLSGEGAAFAVNVGAREFGIVCSRSEIFAVSFYDPTQTDVRVRPTRGVLTLDGEAFELDARGMYKAVILDFESDAAMQRIGRAALSARTINWRGADPSIFPSLSWSLTPPTETVQAAIVANCGVE